MKREPAPAAQNPFLDYAGGLPDRNGWWRRRLRWFRLWQKSSADGGRIFAEIGADNAQRAAMMELYNEWEHETRKYCKWDRRCPRHDDAGRSD